MLTFLKVCIQHFYIFCKQVLEIINRGFEVDDYDGIFENPLFESEARKTGSCTALTIDLLEINQIKTRDRRKKGLKGYALNQSITKSTTRLTTQK